MKSTVNDISNVNIYWTETRVLNWTVEEWRRTDGRTDAPSLHLVPWSDSRPDEATQLDLHDGDWLQTRLTVDWPRKRLAQDSRLFKWLKHFCVWRGQLVWPFLPRDAMHARYKPWAGVRVCVCVCLSVTSRCSTKTAKRRITQTTPHDSPETLVFWCQRSPRNSTGRGGSTGPT